MRPGISTSLVPLRSEINQMGRRDAYSGWPLWAAAKENRTFYAAG